MISLFGAFVTLLLPFIGLNLPGAMIRSFHNKNVDNATYRFQILVITACAFLIITGGLYLFVFVGKVRLFRGLPKIWLLGGCFLALGSSLFQIQKASWQISCMALNYAFFENLRTLVEYILIAAFLYLSFGPDGVVLSRIIVAILFGFGAFLAISKSDIQSYLRSQDKKKYALGALAFGLPLLPHSISGIINTAGSKIIISQTLGASEIAFVSLAIQFGGIVSMFLSSVNMAFTPWFYKSMASRSDNQDKKVVIAIYYLYFLAGLLAFSVIIASPFLLHLMTTAKYWQAEKLIPWFVLASTLEGCYLFQSIFIFLSGKTYYLSFITISSSMIYLVVAWFASAYFGSKGLAVCYFLVMLFKFSCTWFVGARLIKMPWFISFRLS